MSSGVLGVLEGVGGLRGCLVVFSLQFPGDLEVPNVSNFKMSFS